jgi:hypothetical protein
MTERDNPLAVDNFGGDYARDTHRGGLGADYARDDPDHVEPPKEHEEEEPIGIGKTSE